MSRQTALQNSIQNLVSRWAKRKRVLKPGEQIKVNAWIETVPTALVAMVSLSGNDRIVPIPDYILNASVDELNLGTRAGNILNNACITTIGKLLDTPVEQLKKYRNSGPTAIADIRRGLADFNLKLDGYPVWTGEPVTDLGLPSYVEKNLKKIGIHTKTELLSQSLVQLQEKGLFRSSAETIKRRMRSLGHPLSE